MNIGVQGQNTSEVRFSMLQQSCIELIHVYVLSNMHDGLIIYFSNDPKTLRLK